MFFCVALAKKDVKNNSKTGANMLPHVSIECCTNRILIGKLSSVASRAFLAGQPTYKHNKSWNMVKRPSSSSSSVIIGFSWFYADIQPCPRCMRLDSLGSFSENLFGVDERVNSILGVAGVAVVDQGLQFQRCSWCTSWIRDMLKTHRNKLFLHELAGWHAGASRCRWGTNPCPQEAPAEPLYSMAITGTWRKTILTVKKIKKNTHRATMTRVYIHAGFSIAGVDYQHW